jgi:hypothetical protein
MALEIDGFAVFHSIGSHRAAFAGISADLVKARANPCRQVD